MKSKQQKPSTRCHNDDPEASPESTPSNLDESISAKTMFEQETVATAQDLELGFSRNSLHDGSCKFSVHNSGHSRGGKTNQSVVLNLDASVLKMVSRMNEEDCDDEDDHPRCCQNYHVFCGCCCCDIRRASIIANIIYIVIAIFLIIFVFMAERMGIQTQYDDEELQEFIDSNMHSTLPRNSIGIVVAAGAGVYGAMNFRKWLVLAMVCWYGVYLIWAVMSMRYFSGIFAGIMIYPNLALFLALKNEKLTPDNYATTGLCCPSCDSEKKKSSSSKA